uniref:Macrophage mannose receptor 1-like n=1 Tax=Diabrotica virgifera virgifera TaxID=50390 RepID=A0A6P7H0S0_DIAVI
TIEAPTPLRGLRGFDKEKDTIVFEDTIYYIGYAWEGNWLQAMFHCKSLDMDLLSIESKEENDFLSRKLKELLQGREYNFYTSGTRLPYNKWIWMSTGRPVTFTNWKPNEPNNYMDNDETCIEVQYRYETGLRWNDENRETSDNVICEAKITKDCELNSYNNV